MKIRPSEQAVFRCALIEFVEVINISLIPSAFFLPRNIKRVVAKFSFCDNSFTGLAVKALNLSGDLEQNLGGSEAVFKDFADKMQGIGKTAFKDMGLGTSDFLATANKMGALFQGAGFGIEESADLSSKAMQRAADVASIMGIDSASAMEAVAGAAKGNFTMMDNLGVAMNDTAIQNYALSKGINTSTAEMSQQEKIGLAMEMFLDKTSYAAGNYAKENDTLAGSLGTAKSALTNFLDGSGDVDALVESLSGAGEVIISNVTTLLPRLTSGLTQLIQKFIPMLPEMLQAMLPGVIQGAVSLINGLVQAIPTIIGVLMGALPLLIAGIAQIFNSLVAALPQLMQTLISSLPVLIPQLINALVSMLLMLMQYWPQILQPIIDALPSLIISVVNALMMNLPALINGLVQMMVGIVSAMPQLLLALNDSLPTVISSIVTGLFQALPVLITGLIEMLGAVGTNIKTILSGIFGMVWQLISDIFAPIGEFFSGIWDGIVGIFSVVVDWFKGIFDSVTAAIHTVIDPWIEIFTRIWTKIKEAFAPVIQFFKETFDKAWGKIKEIFEPVAKFFSSIWDGIKGAFGAVADWFGSIFSKAWSAVKDVFSTGGKIFDGIKDGIANVFKTVVNGIIGGINKVIAVPFKAINAFLKVLKAISIVGIKPFSWITTLNVPEIPKLFKGGVLKRGQTGYLEGNGDEAVVPLEKNTGWIKTVAEKIHAFSLESKSADTITPVTQLSTVIKTEIGQRIQSLESTLSAVVEMLKQFFPQLLDAFDVNMVLDDGTLVAKLTPKIDKQLGKIYIQKGRGNA